MSIVDRLRWLFWPTSQSEFKREKASQNNIADVLQETPNSDSVIKNLDTLVYPGPLDTAWALVVRQVAGSLDAMTSFLTVNVSGTTREQCEPYVQASRGDQGIMLLEAVSDNNLNAPLSATARNTLSYLGWCEPDNNDQNHYIVLSSHRPANTQVAEFLVRTLLDVYGVNSSCEFEYSTE